MKLCIKCPMTGMFETLYLSSLIIERAQKSYKPNFVWKWKWRLLNYSQFSNTDIYLKNFDPSKWAWSFISTFSSKMFVLMKIILINNLTFVFGNWFFDAFIIAFSPSQIRGRVQCCFYLLMFSVHSIGYCKYFQICLLK